jgi:hypothetical protein
MKREVRRNSHHAYTTEFNQKKNSALISTSSFGILGWSMKSLLRSAISAELQQ